MNHTHADTRREGGSGGPPAKESSLTKEEAVRSVKILAIAAGLLLACAAGPASADSPVPAPDSVWTADTALLRTPAAATDTAANPAPSVSDGAPSPAEIATMRERVNYPITVRGRVKHPITIIRVFLGRDAYDVRGARFDSRGVAFAPGNLRGVPAWDNGGSNGDGTRPAPLASPIGWDRIERITMRKPCGARGALVGAVAGGVAYAAICGWVRQSNGEVGMEGLVLLPLAPLGALLGSAFGAFRWRSEPVWRRAGTDPGSTAPSRR